LLGSVSDQKGRDRRGHTESGGQHRALRQTWHPIW
jgi:hypothetical protein